MSAAEISQSIPHEETREYGVYFAPEADAAQLYVPTGIVWKDDSQIVKMTVTKGARQGEPTH